MYVRSAGRIVAFKLDKSQSQVVDVWYLVSKSVTFDREQLLSSKTGISTLQSEDLDNQERHKDAEQEGPTGIVLQFSASCASLDLSVSLERVS